MKERDFQRLFSQFMKTDDLRISAAFELKLEKGKSMRFDKLAEHQQKALLSAKNDRLYHRITDQPFIKDLYQKVNGQFIPYKAMRFQWKKPCDAISIHRGSAYVVILFYKPRCKKIALFIDIDRYMKAWKEASDAGRSSWKEMEFLRIADFQREMREAR